MIATLWKQAKPSCLLFFWLSVLTGIAYPLVVTVLGNGLFPSQARGSRLLRDGVAAGSALVGQPFVSDRYFQGRPSATAPFPYNAAASSGSNLAPSNPDLRQSVMERTGRLATEHPGQPLPMDLATTSASGLDPHMSPAAAEWQIDRVARARGMTPQSVAELVARHTEGPLWGFWGEPRVNVLLLNLALDAMTDPK